MKLNAWTVEIVNVIEDSNTISVSINELEFGLTAISQPLHMIKIPVTNNLIVVI